MRFSLFLLLIIFIGCTPQERTQRDTLVSLLDANISHLDPIHSINKYSSTINASIFEGLYHYHYLKRPYTIEPKIAAAMPQISQDGLTYTIKIKKGILFQDDPAFANGKGRELTTQDIIYSWKRLADPKNKALGWWVFDGLIKGLNQWRDDLRVAKATYETPVEGLKALDKYTIVITLTRPSLQFLHFLSMPVTMITAHEVVNHYGKEIINHPVGTGPYRLVKWVRNSEIRLEKNKSYRQVLYPGEGSVTSKSKGHLKHAGTPLPLSENVIVRILRERQPQWLSFLKGQIDHGIIPKENNDQIIQNEKITDEYLKKGIRIYNLHKNDIIYIAFNMENPILGKNKHLRKAMALALDKKLIKKNFYSSRGVIAHSPIPPQLDAYDPNYVNSYEFNLEKAKKEMELAGYPDGKGLITFDFELASVDTWSRQFGEFLKDQWSKIGVNIRLVANTWPQFDKKIKEKKATIYNMAWSADYPDSENFLQLFYSKNISPGSNNANFINRDYDTIYEKSLTLPPGKQRDQLYRQLVEILDKEIPSIFIIHRIFRLPFHGWLENYNEDPIIFDYLQYMKVDPKKKAQLIKGL